MRIPTDNIEGYERARKVDPKVAENYIAHTYLGDPVGDEAMMSLAGFDHGEVREILRAGMDQDFEALKSAPAPIREFFESMVDPEWLDRSQFMPGRRMFHRNANIVLGSFVGGTLIEGFSTNISKSFFITGRVRDQGVRRLQQNNRHLVESFLPGGLERDGDGWKLSVRLRLIHCQVRRLLSESDEWDEEAWGIPLSSAHLGYAITAFSARLLKHMKRLGASYSDEERDSFMAVWRYVGYLMGIPETILFEKYEDALELFDIGGMCEPEPGVESISMANSLINSAPLFAGLTEPNERRKFAKYVYGVSRAVIGNKLANQLKYPATSTVGVLVFFRVRQRYERLMRNPKIRRIPVLSHIDWATFDQFSTLISVSAFDEAGISYAVPDHVYNEESSEW